jgi:hypothetical protein
METTFKPPEAPEKHMSRLILCTGQALNLETAKKRPTHAQRKR